VQTKFTTEHSVYVDKQGNFVSATNKKGTALIVVTRKAIVAIRQ
jgi:hypothetical protein